jgi:2-polyprenyl-3-methyl-5-hydroxy-6-metoxy-1,4-benzoquinol methylase
MEVLEHVLNPDQFLDNFHRWLAPGGILLLSVPVEIGLSVVIKQAVRQINGWRGIGDYPGTTSYTWGEMVRAVFAGPTQHVERPIHRNPDGSEFHDHKGFNWRLLRRKIQDRFELLDERSSPVAWLPAWVASQMWFKARKRA